MSTGGRGFLSSGPIGARLSVTGSHSEEECDVRRTQRKHVSVPVFSVRIHSNIKTAHSSPPSLSAGNSNEKNYTDLVKMNLMQRVVRT